MPSEQAELYRGEIRARTENVLSTTMAYGQDDYYQEFMQPKQQQTYDGKRMRTKPINRKSVDYATSVINHMMV